MMTRTRLRRSVSFLIAMLAIVSFNQLSAMLDLPFKVADVIADAAGEE